MAWGPALGHGPEFCSGESILELYRYPRPPVLSQYFFVAQIYAEPPCDRLFLCCLLQKRWGRVIDEATRSNSSDGSVAFPKRRLEIDNGDEPVPVYVVNSHDPRAGAFLRPSLLASLSRQIVPMFGCPLIRRDPGYPPAGPPHSLF